MASRKSQRTIHYPGQPDLDRYHQGPARWRRLRQKEGDTEIIVYGYEAGNKFVGIPPTDMNRAPCSHCGQLAFARFAHDTAAGVLLDKDNAIVHTCPGFLGRDSRGEEVPCPQGQAHVCTGKPSMSWHGVSFYPWYDWKEVTW